MGRATDRSDRAGSLRQWVEGHRAAGRIIESERREWLAALDESTALGLYLELVAIPSLSHDERSPSPVLAAMRRALARRERTVG